MAPGNESIFLERSRNRDRVILELGPGHKRKYQDSIAIDRVPLKGVDIVADIEQGLGFIPDRSVDLVYSSHFMEHIGNLEHVLREFSRVLKAKGEIIIIVPHFSNPYYYSDYTHKNFWGLYTPFYFSKESFFKRKVPSYYNDLDILVTDIKIRFYSPFMFRNVFKKVLQFIFNLSRYMQELYEENFCYLFPAYEMRITIIKR